MQITCLSITSQTLVSLGAFSRLARLHFTTGSTKAIISRKQLLRFTLSRSARNESSTPIGVISHSELRRLARLLTLRRFIALIVCRDERGNNILIKKVFLSVWRFYLATTLLVRFVVFAVFVVFVVGL
jgi:hypothetical protein